MVTSPEKVQNSDQTCEAEQKKKVHSHNERMAKQKIQSQNLIMFLTSNKNPEGMTKNEIRNIRNQAKTHLWDAERKSHI